MKTSTKIAVNSILYMPFFNHSTSGNLAKLMLEPS